MAGGGAGAHASRSERAAAWVFGAVVAAALPIYLYLARKQWFFQDDWEFLAHRDAGSFRSLMEPHNEHWSTLPVIVYRALWHLVGLHTYRPYQLLTIILHLAVAVLLRAVMRRAGVHPWLATAAAAAFVLFGSGFQDITWGFQIGYVAPIALGIAQLMISDHDGPVGRRDGLAVACGALALLCSGTAVTMVAVVGLAVLIRRGLRPALVQVLPLASLYLAWWLAYGREGSPKRQTATIRQFVTFVVKGFWSIAQSLTQFTPLAVLLVVVVAVGAVLAVVQRGPDWRARWAVPIAMAGGSLIFFSITAFGRAGLSVEDAEKSRYVHVGLALLLPAMAVALDALVRRWSWLLIPIAVLLLIGVPGNLGEVRAIKKPNFEGSKRDVLVLASSDELADLPDNFRPFLRAEHNISAGWLRESRADGFIPEPKGGMTDQAKADAFAIVALSGTETARSQKCREVPPAAFGEFEKGDEIRFRGQLEIKAKRPGGTASSPRLLKGRGHTVAVKVREGPLVVTFRSIEGGALCRGS